MLLYPISTSLSLSRHQSLEQDSTLEVLEVQNKLDATEVLLAERERELATAQEKLTTLSEDLIASQSTVRDDEAVLMRTKYAFAMHLL